MKPKLLRTKGNSEADVEGVQQSVVEYIDWLVPATIEDFEKDLQKKFPSVPIEILADIEDWTLRGPAFDTMDIQSGTITGTAGLAIGALGNYDYATAPLKFWVSGGNATYNKYEMEGTFKKALEAYASGCNC
jgi:hypothetical protein